MSVSSATTVPVERYIAAIDAAEMLWTVIANVSNGDWHQQSPEWQLAAARWRDNYHDELLHFRLLSTKPSAPFTGAHRPKPPWRLLCGCSADANDNRTWCATHRPAPLRSPQDCDPLLAAERAFANHLQVQLDALCLERDTLRAQLADARSALARIRDMASPTASFADPPPSIDQRLDWCASEAVLALDRTSPTTTP